MTVPTKTWNTISDGQVDADSPLDETLLTAIRDNLVHLEEWLGDGYTAAKDHDHDGVNSKSVVLEAGVVTQTKIAASAVGQGELKTATGSGSVEVASLSNNTLALTGGTWSMWTGSGGGNGSILWGGGNTTAGTLGFYNTDGATPQSFFVDERYVQASPPYKIGDTAWGHFFYLLRRISDGEILGSVEAQDPTWAYNGAFWIPDETDDEGQIVTLSKDRPERIITAPHPFASYWENNPAVKNPKNLAAEGLEVVLIDLREFDVEKLKLDSWKKGEKPNEELIRQITVGGEHPYSDYGLPEISGLTDVVKIRARN